MERKSQINLFNLVSENFKSLLTLIIFLIFTSELKAQITCTPYQAAPQNNDKGEGGEWYPYLENIGTNITIYGYPTKYNKGSNIILNFYARQWKYKWLWVQRYVVDYLGNRINETLTISLDENTKTDNGNQINLTIEGDLRHCKIFGNHNCATDIYMTPFGKIAISVEIPDWDQSQWVTNICHGEKPFDISHYLINVLTAKYGGQIQNARYFVDGLPLSNSIFDPSKFTPGNHIITAQKTYCNSTPGWGGLKGAGDYISPSYTITVTAPAIQFPKDNAFLCTNSAPISLLANPTGGVWSDINNPENKALTGNIFDPSKTLPGNYTLRYTYVDPVTNCRGSKDLPVVVNYAPTITPASDISVLYNSAPITLSGDLPKNGTYSGLGVKDNLFDPAKGNLCNNTITYTVTDPLTQCSSSINRNINIIPVIGPDFSVCNNASTYNLLGDVNPKGGVFSGSGVSGNNFNPQSLSPGDYTISYSITNATGCIAKNSRIISVLPTPNSPIISGNMEGCDGTNITLQASGNNSGIAKFEWYKSGDNNPFFTGNTLNYLIKGSETLNCYAVNNQGCVSSPPALIKIISDSPLGDFKADTTKIAYGTSVNFKSTVQGVSYNWDFGDGGVAVKQNPSHYYYASGLFTVKLLVTSFQGCIKEILKTNYILVGSEIPQIPVIHQPNGTGFDSSQITYNVFPSPFRNFLTITCLLKLDQVISVNLFDLQGHRINQFIFNGKKGPNTFTINQLSQLGSGVYYLVKINSAELNHTEKILKL